MDEGDLPELAYLNKARVINPIVEKMPYVLQEDAGSHYKDHFKVTFPPFTFFSEFVRNHAGARNDPRLTLTSFVNTQPSKKEGKDRTQVSTRKTVVVKEPTRNNSNSD